MKIQVIDAIMGAGKTTYILNKINAEHQEWISSLFSNPKDKPKYLYVTPTLDEVSRVQKQCAIAEFKEPEARTHGSKYYDFKKLVEEGTNIVTTHSLFRLLSKDTYDLIKEQGYTLVIDEALDCVDLFTGLTKADREMLLDSGMIYVQPDTHRLCWNEDDHADYTGKFERIQTLCRNGNLVYFQNTTLLWEFPVEFIGLFKEVYVLTYLFHGSAMANYLAANGVGFAIQSVQNGELTSWTGCSEKAIKDKLRGLITIYEGRSNKIGDKQPKSNPLSSSWYDRMNKTEDGLKPLKNGLEMFFNKYAKSPSCSNAWTTFKEYRSSLAGKGYSKGFLPNNLRATNDYIDKTTAAYTCNTFYHPIIRNYFVDRGVVVYEDIYALSEMLQWLWRFQIRRYDPVTLYIPSQRMRELLKAWLETDDVTDLFYRLGY